MSTAPTERNGNWAISWKAASTTPVSVTGLRWRIWTREKCGVSPVFSGCPGDIIEQSPSPGFGGVLDEHFLGPYEIVDRVLRGLRLGWSDGAILRALKDYTRHGKRPLSKRFRPFLRKAYVAYLRGLRTLSAEKGGWQEGEARGVG